MKKTSLAAGLQAAAGRTSGAVAELETPAKSAAKVTGEKDVMIGGFYPKDVRKALKLVEAETGKRLNQLLGEAINDLCAKYGKPQPYTDRG